VADPARPQLREAPYGYTLTLVPGAPEAVKGLSQAFWSEDGTVPARTKELVFIRTSQVNRCET
jgi:hypothetical protein